MNNLHFAYASAPTNQVLRNVTLQINPGTCTAIVGASGCGKSTIAALLLRLYDPLPAAPAPHPFQPSPPTHHRPSLTPIFESPRPPPLPPSITSPLTYASLPASVVSTSSLRSYLAYVPQHPFLFPTTIAANITYGLHDSSPLNNHHFIETAARRAGIHDFIASLPHGYDTPVGEGGQALSGGQAQRVALARAIIRKPRMIVLDEPTSALDAEGAEGVRVLVNELVEEEEGMAVVVVTHSKEMMRACNEVVMVEGGCVVERGGYEELVARGGRFAELVGGGQWIGGGRRKRKERERRVHEETLMRLEGEGEGSGSGDQEGMWREVRF